MKKKIAILVGADLLSGKTGSGGLGSVADFLVRQYKKSGIYEPFLISVSVTRDDINSIRLLSPNSWNKEIKVTDKFWKNIPGYHVGAFFTEIEFLRYFPRKPLTNILERADIIQVVSGGPAIAYATKDAGVPMCLQMASTVKLEREPRLNKAGLFKRAFGHAMLPFVTEIEKKAIGLAEHIFADTQYTADAISDLVPPNKVTIDTIGVDTSKFQPSRVRSDDYLLCTGRLGDVRKNVSMLFHSYALLRKMNEKCPPLVLAGRSGPSSIDWRLADELDIRQYITFLPSVSETELVKLYQNATCFLLSSDEEGLGIVLLEAMACGTPVVATACGGPNTVVEPDAGILTPVGDSHAFAEAVDKLLQNKSHRLEMGKSASIRVKNRFSDEVVAEKYYKIYRTLV